MKVNWMFSSLIKIRLYPMTQDNRIAPSSNRYLRLNLPPEVINSIGKSPHQSMQKHGTLFLIMLHILVTKEWVTRVELIAGPA